MVGSDARKLLDFKQLEGLKMQPPDKKTSHKSSKNNAYLKKNIILKKNWGARHSAPHPGVAAPVHVFYGKTLINGKLIYSFFQVVKEQTLYCPPTALSRVV